MTAAPQGSDDPVAPVPADAVALGDLDGSVSFMLRIAQVTVYDRIFSAEADLPLKLGEHTVLKVVGDNPGARQGAIADKLMIKWSHMTKVVSGLEERGLVERYVPPQDRRSVFLRLTDAGRHVVADMNLRLDALDAGATAALDADDRAELLRLLHKILGWPSATSS
ncbi:MarR family transcriptional regulator [Mesobaculum littorinae]|uniref:MarR family transcriptional regulator n=1 Tax=Mesobaculum littorinae TaxID=2486419 RepID=A0A438AHB2_9RHOB|nr:MarR family winged helix-turn-helix transcriptional regulator [Mesobaculum littorinae]RVV98119.1 MarR family transcriptional regulator [Mesobaculum littorinae]